MQEHKDAGAHGLLIFLPLERQILCELGAEIIYTVY